MTVPECPREQDVINAIVTGRWPHQCDETLTAHAAECRVCKELVDVASVSSGARASRSFATLPSRIHTAMPFRSFS